jgi:hypothetical protein
MSGAGHDPFSPKPEAARGADAAVSGDTSHVRDLWPDESPDPLHGTTTLADLESLTADIAKEYKTVRAQQRASQDQDEPRPGLMLVRGNDIVDVGQTWLVDQFLPEATLSLIAGLPGAGKTTAALSIGASITVGEIPITGGSRSAGDVLMLSNEDSPAHIRRTFERLGGDLSRLLVESDQGLPWLLDDCASLENAMEQYKPSLAIIDSFYSHAPSKTDTHKHAEIAPVLLRLRKIANAHGCAIVLIHHVNKSLSDQPLLKISGTIGITAVARHVLLVGTHPENTDLRVLAIAKTNLAKPGVPSQVFRLDPFNWMGSSTLQAAELVQPALSSVDCLDRGVELLRKELANGSRFSTDLQVAAKAAGISWRTLRRAQEKLGIRPRKDTNSPKPKWLWSLPQHGQEDDGNNAVATLDTLGMIRETENLPTLPRVSPQEDTKDGHPGHLLETGQQVGHLLEDALSLADETPGFKL